MTNEANDQIAAFDGLNTGAGPGMIIEAMQHDAIRGVAHGTNKSVLYAYHKGDGWGVYAIGRRAGVYGEANLGPGVKGLSSAGHGIDGASSAAGKSGVYAHHSGDGWGVYGVGSRAGVRGDAGAGPGVQGLSTSGNGVQGEAKAANKSGVYAFNDHASGFGVYARGGHAGVRAHSSGGWGLHASSAAENAAGIYCANNGATGTGCMAFGGKRGLHGGASIAAGTGVYAENIYGGVGLRVVGKTSLERSGVATTVVGYAYKTVSVPGGVTAASKFLVTMQGSPGAGVFVTYAKYLSATQFRVYFNKACTAAAKLAWMVLD